MNTNDPIYIGAHAADELVKYVASHNLTRLTLVADENTYQALGQRVEAVLSTQPFDLTTIVLRGEEIIADEQHLIQVLVQAPVAEQTFLAVGSGTITDITRFVSHRTRNPFISLPTAPSVDGFTSIGAPLVLEGVKRTLSSQAPLAIFADLPTLQAAPQPLIAAGFGDMLGKVTSVADWKLGWLLWDEPYDAAIAQRARVMLDTFLSHVNAIGAGTETGIRHLMDGLIESGLRILEFGSSPPASGAEHHCSHYWEMMLLREHRPAILHGAKVGVATILVADLYQRLRRMSRDEMSKVLAEARIPDRQKEIETIRTAYGPAAEAIIREQAGFLNMTNDQFGQLKTRILERWDAVQEIAASVPSGEAVANMLRRVQGPTTGQELGLSADEVRRGMQYGHYLRNRFTIRKLFHLLNLG